MPNQYSYKTHEQKVEVFWSRVDRSGGDDACWNWTAGKIGSGYGSMGWYGKRTLAHRIAYTLVIGPIPDGLWALHKCDNPACVNPAHLWLGTNQDNVDDRERKGRHGYVTISDAQAAEIRRRYAEGGILQREIAAEYGIDRSHVSLIVNRKSRI